MGQNQSQVVEPRRIVRPLGIHYSGTIADCVCYCKYCNTILKVKNVRSHVRKLHPDHYTKGKLNYHQLNLPNH